MNKTLKNDRVLDENPISMTSQKSAISLKMEYTDVHTLTLTITFKATSMPMSIKIIHTILEPLHWVRVMNSVGREATFARPSTKAPRAFASYMQSEKKILLRF